MSDDSTTTHTKLSGTTKKIWFGALGLIGAYVAIRRLEGKEQEQKREIDLPNPAQFRWDLPPQDVKFENDTLAGRVSSCSFIIYRKIDTSANLIGAAAFSASIETNGWAAEDFQFAFTLYDVNQTVIGGWNVNDLIISCVEGEPKVVEVGLIAPIDASLIDNIQYVSYVAGGGQWVKCPAS